MKIHGNFFPLSQHIVKDVVITKEVKEKENNIFRVLLCWSENIYLALYRNSGGIELNDKGNPLPFKTILVTF